MNIFNKAWVTKIDAIIIKWMSRNGYLLMRLSIGLIFVWFGFLKFFPGISPVEKLAIKTISKLSFNLLPDYVIITNLAISEVVIGIFLLLGKFIRQTLLLLFIHMIGTFIPVFLFPNEVFLHFPYALTIEGQYIFKNLVFITAGIVIGGKLSKHLIDE